MGYYGLQPIGGKPGIPVADKVPGYHTVDGDTILCWQLNGSGVDTGSLGIDLSLGTAQLAPYTENDFCYRQTGSAAINSGSLSGTAAKTAGSITIAGWFWFIDGTPPGNTALIGVRSGGSSGNPDAFNFPWELGITNTGLVRAFHQYDNKQDVTAVAGSPVAEGVWTHLAGSRSSDGLTWKVYQNGIEIATASGTAGDEWDGGSLQNVARVTHNSIGTEVLCYVASGIVKTTTLNTGTAAALYEGARRGVI